MTSHSDPSTFCIKSVKPQTLEQDITVTENFNFGEALGQVYPLLDIIFKYLSINDLKSCLEVSPWWKEKAEEAMSRRTATPSWCTCYKINSRGLKSNVISHSDNLSYNNVEIGIFICDSDKWNLNSRICLHNDITEVRKSVSEYLEEELLPKQVDYCLISVPRAVSYFGGIRTVKDVKMNGSIFDGVFIPKIPSVRTAMFYCNLSNKKKLKRSFSTYIRDNEEPKCILLFCKTQARDTVTNFWELLEPKVPSLPALGGGIIKETKTFQEVSRKKKHSANDTLCIAFLKNQTSELDNFRAYSCSIEGSFHAELIDFKKKVTLKKHTLAFRFCWPSRSEYEDERELESFQEVFPGLPLVGFDTHQEIGWNSYPTCRVRILRPILRSCGVRNFSSNVLVLITWD